MNKISLTIGRFDRWRRAVPEWLFRDVMLALMVGLVLFAAQECYADKAATRAEQLENLRFVRDLSLDRKAARPFSGMDLRGQDLTGLYLAGANFSRAHLEGANLSATILTDAIFTDAHMEGASLHNARAQRADFDGVHAKGVDFGNAQLDEAFFHYSDLRESNLGSAQSLHGVVLANGTDLAGATPFDGFDADMTDGCYDEGQVRLPRKFAPAGHPERSCVTQVGEHSEYSELPDQYLD